MDKEQEMMKRLEGIKNLPTLPVVIDQLNAAIQDPNTDGRRIAKIIEDDPSIMARTMRVVNSVFYGGQDTITSLPLAVSRLGFSAIRNIAMSTSVFSTFGAGDGQGLNRKEFWRHSICTGIAASVIGTCAREHLHRRYPKDALHLAGLLHDMGKIFYDEFFHDEFAEALRMANAEKTPLFMAEKAVMGMDHAQAGAWLGMKWKLGIDLTQAIYLHHDPDRCADDKLWEFIALVHTANYICNIEKIGDGGDPAPGFNAGVWKRLGLEVSDISGVVDTVKEESAKSEILMSLA